MSMPDFTNAFISSVKTLGSITTPLPIKFFAFSLNIPEGNKWKKKVPNSLITVCPALFPPENLAITS